MDPIHPIVPVTPNILPILPTPMTGQVDRDAARGPAQERRRDRRRAPGGRADGDAERPATDPYAELPPGDEDDGLGHVDLTA